MGLHHQIMQSLIREIRNLREELDYQKDATYRGYERARQQRERDGRMLRDAQEREENLCYEQYERDDAIRALEKARRRGDYWGERRAREKLGIGRG